MYYFHYAHDPVFILELSNPYVYNIYFNFQHLTKNIL